MSLPRLFRFTSDVRPFIVPFAVLALSMGAGRPAAAQERPAPVAGGTPRSVVFVVDTVRDWPALVEALPGRADVVVLDGRRDGLSQMAERLVGQHGLAAIHVLSHGDVGRIQLGSVWLDADAARERRRDLTAIGHALRPGGDLLLYGCAIAGDGAGRPFLEAVARETGADVAASADATGAASKGGNWTLEVAHGAVEAPPLTPTGYDGLLVAFSDTFATDTGTAVTSFVRALAGVNFTFTFTAQGDGGDFAWDNANGSGGSSSVSLYSGAPSAATERVTIARNDTADFTFSGLFVNNPAGGTVIVAGYLDNTLVGSAQTVATGVAGTLSFGALRVDEVRVTSDDFFGITIDDFSGDTDPPLTVPSLTATAANPTFTEGGSAVDLFQSVTAATNDGGQTFAGLTLTVTNVGNGGSEVLSIAGTSVSLVNGNSGALSGGGTYSVSVASSTATVTLFGLARTDAQMATLVDGLTYANTSNDPGTSSRVATITGITDSGGSNNTAAPNRVSTVSVTPVNDAPTLSATAGTPTFTEGAIGADLFSGVSIATIESGQSLVALSLSISGLADGSSEILGIDGTDVALTNGNAVVTSTNAMNVVVSVTGSTATVTISKGGGITSAAAQTLIDGLRYRNSGEAPTTGARTVTLTALQDSGGTANGGVDTTTVSIAASVTVAAVNDAPGITVPGSIAVTEDVASALTGIAFSDADAGSNAITATLSVPSGSLAATSGSGVTVGGTSSSMTLSGSITSINAFIAASGVGFTTAQHASSNVTLTVGADDGGNTGSGGAQTSSSTVTLAVTAVNDAPAVTAPASISVTEDVATALTGIAFSDVDAGGSSVSVSLAVPSGSLAATSGGGVTVGGTSSTMTLTGSIANVNTFIAGSNVTYTSASNASGNVSLTVELSDLGNTGSGGTQTDSTTVTLATGAVNDAPTISAPASIAVTEDVSTAITGIAFSDVDAGSASVTATLSTPSGTFAATSGAGVVVTGSGTGTVSLAGAIANVNAFLAASGLTWTTTAQNPTATVILTVSVDDGGNSGTDPGVSGTGSSEAASTTVTLLVTAVNDAPVNAVPASQTVLVDQVLVFSPGNGNAVTISDVDVASGTLRVTLTASNGLITLSGPTGLSFLVGSGAGDGTMTFEGTATDVNNALTGMSFTPASGYYGSASLQIASSDLGSTGTGGTKTDTDTIAITVTQGNPAVTSVAASSVNGTYKTGDTIALAVSFDQAVTVDTTGGTPTLLLETGVLDRAATYVSGSGSSTLTFAYTVRAGDTSADLDYGSSGALTLNGATIRSAGALDSVLTLPAPGSVASIGGQAAIVVDGVAAVVTSVSVPAAGTYTAGQVLMFGVSMSEAVVVTGTPVLSLGLDTGGPLAAAYVSGSGTTTLQFMATVQAGQDDATGITADLLALGGGAIVDAAGNASVLALNDVGSTTGVLIDTTAPGVTIGAPSVTTTVSGPVTFDVTYTGATTVTLSEANVTLISTGTATATLAVSGTGTTRTVTLSAITGTGSLAISVAAGTAEDAVGQDAPAVGPSAVVMVTARALTSVYPTSGLDTGGVELTLRGVGLATLAAPAVSFGSTPAVLAQVLDDTTLRVVTPALPAGAATVDAGQIVRTGAFDLVLSDAATAVSTLTGGYLPLARPAGDASDLDGDTLPDLWELRHGLDAIAAIDAALDPDGDARSNLVEYAAGTHPRATWTRYFAEGVSSDAMTTTFAAANPGQVRTSVVVHYLRDGGGELTETFDLEPGASVQRAAAQAAGLSGTAYATEIDASVPLVASSLTSWDATEYGAGAESAAAAASTWYLAEGATQGPFDLFYLLANPNATPIDVDVTYLRPTPAAPLVQRVTVPARQRLTLWVDTVSPDLASTDVSAILSSVGQAPFVVERAMYAGDGSGRWGAAGHRAAGVSQPATTWHLPEGYVGGPFDTYLLVSNPQATDATISLDVLGDTGILTTQTQVVAARSRVTIFAGDLGVPDGPVSFTVTSTNAQPVVVERAMWWRETAGAGPWVESHASSGATAGAQRWGLTDVRLGGTRAEAQYLLLQNVDAAAVSVEVTAYLPNGQRETRTHVVSAASRLTLDLAAEFPDAVGGTSSLTISSSGPIVVEASRYWDAAGVHWGAGANLRATPLP